MADPFEISLQKLFQETPVLPDAPLFAARLTARLERDWTLRRLLIGSPAARSAWRRCGS